MNRSGSVIVGRIMTAVPKWVCVCVATVLVAFGASAQDPDSNSLNSERKLEASDIVRKVISKGCSRRYTVTCFKMDMVELVDLLSETKRYQLFPGVAVVRDNTSQVPNNKLPEEVVKSLARNFPYGEDTQLDDFLVSKITDYLNTHSVSLKLLDPVTAEKTRAVGDELFGVEGRGKGNKGGYGGLMAGVMMMKGTLMTIGFGALAALAGKALMTGLLSLMLSAILGLKGASGGGHKQTTYEIISKPVYSHSHSHSSEVQHDHHDHGGHSASYSYGRNLDTQHHSSKHSKTAGGVTRTSEIQYIQLPEKEEEAEEVDSESEKYQYGNVEYKTISEEDLKGYYNPSNIDYAALSGGSHTHEQDTYRQQKSIHEEEVQASQDSLAAASNSGSPSSSTSRSGARR